MKCLEFKKNIFLYLELKEKREDTTIFDAHIKGCVLCQKEVNNYLELEKKLKEIEDISPPKNYKANFWKALEYREQLNSVKIKQRAYYGLAASLVLVISLIFLLKFYALKPQLDVQDIKDEKLLLEINELLNTPVIYSNSAFTMTEEEINYLNTEIEKNKKEKKINMNKNFKEVNHA